MDRDDDNSDTVACTTTLLKHMALNRWMTDRIQIPAVVLPQTRLKNIRAYFKGSDENTR